MAAQNDPTIVTTWIEEVWKASGTDLLLTADSPPLARVDGEYRALDGEALLTAARTEEIARKMLAPGLMAQLEADNQVDFSMTWQDNVRVRGNAFLQRGAIAIALRIIPIQIP